MYRKKLVLSKKLDADENDDSGDSNHVPFDESGEMDDEASGDSADSRPGSPVGGRNSKKNKVRNYFVFFYKLIKVSKSGLNELLHHFISLFGH